MAFPEKKCGTEMLSAEKHGAGSSDAKTEGAGEPQCESTECVNMALQRMFTPMFIVH